MGRASRSNHESYLPMTKNAIISAADQNGLRHQSLPNLRPGQMQKQERGLLKFYDFFAGAGMATLGLSAHWECVWANDIDERKAQVYGAHFGREHFIRDDVANIKAASLPKPAHLAWASFPCQDLSLAGWQRGLSAERSGAFWPFWRIMHDLLEVRAATSNHRH